MFSQPTPFQKAADRIRQSELVVPVFLAFFALWLLGLSFAVEDYWTSLWGYESLPTQVGFAWTPYLVAALPSVGQIAAGYLALALGWENQRDRKYTVISLLVWCILLYIDVFTDLFYRVSGLPLTPAVTATALFQTIGIFTIGSELAVVVGMGMSLQLLPDALGQLLALPVRLSHRLLQLQTPGSELPPDL